MIIRSSPSTPFASDQSRSRLFRWLRAVADFAAYFVRGSMFLLFGPDKSHVRVQSFGQSHPFPSSNPQKKTQKSRYYTTLCDTILHDFVKKSATACGHLRLWGTFGLGPLGTSPDCNPSVYQSQFLGRGCDEALFTEKRGFSAKRGEAIQ